MFNLNFEGKIVLVTGASRGIGMAIAKEFADLGATVCGTATSQAGADAISAYLGDKGTGFVMNALDKEQVEGLIPAITAKYGSCPDIIVNNAGITKDGLLMTMKDDAWNDVISCNLTAIATLCRSVVRPLMKKRWGRIINITSITGEIGNAGQCNYAAAKAGLIGFSKSLAREIASRNITVNCVAPGFIETDMTKALNEKQLEDWCNTIPLKRAGQGTDIAGAVVFLASDLASYITGATIDVNGGLHCA